MKQFTKAVGGMKSSVIYTDADRRHFRFSEGTWAWRNHNSGNVYPKQHGKFTNQIGKTHNFAIFSDDQSGHYKTRPNRIVNHRDITVYTPP